MERTLKFTTRLLLLISLCVTLRFRTIHGGLFTSVPRMEELYRREGRLLDTLQASIEYHEAKLDMLVQRHRQIMSQRAEKGSIEEHLGHPVNGFSLIKRLSRDWPFIVNIMAENYNVSPTLLKEMQSFSEDTQVAIRGLVRLQKVYKLNTDQLADGWVAGSKSRSTLTAEDCLEVAQFLSQRHEFILGISWLWTAERRVEREKDTSVSQQEVASLIFTFSMLATCEQKDFLHVLPRTLLSLDTTYVPEAATAKLYHHALDKNCSWYDSNLKWDEMDMTEDNHEKFNEMCRGEPKHPRGLKCRYVHYHRPVLRLAPFKLEEILISPPIVLVHQVISETEIEDLKKAAISEFSDCQTGNHNVTKTSLYRTCERAWVKDSITPSAAILTRRIGQFSNLGMAFSEMHQVACYGLGGEYKLHKDTFQNLNDVTKGGYTVFPLLKVAVAPVKGAAVYWYNIHHDSSEDERTLHGGCPVLLGSKWVLNKWVHEGGQAFESHHCPSDEHFPREYFYL